MATLGLLGRFQVHVGAFEIGTGIVHLTIEKACEQFVIDIVVVPDVAS